MEIKELVSGGKSVFFAGKVGDVLLYRADNGFLFEIPKSDWDGASFEAEDKAMLFMRWIRKQLSSDKPAIQPSPCRIEEFSFVKLVRSELWYADADGFEFPVLEGFKNELLPFESESSIGFFKNEHLRSISEARKSIG